MTYVLALKPSARRANAAVGHEVNRAGTTRVLASRAAAEAWAGYLSAAGGALVWVHDANPGDDTADGYLLRRRGAWRERATDGTTLFHVPSERENESMPRPSDFAQDGWPVAGQEDDETEYIGTTTPGNPMVYNANEHTLFGVEVDEQKQRLEPIGNTVQNLGADETISDAINRVGEELGWSSLSEFGEGESQQDES